MRRNRTLYLDDELVAKTAALAKKNRRSASAELEIAMEEHLEKNGIPFEKTPEETS